MTTLALAYLECLGVVILAVAAGATEAAERRLRWWLLVTGALAVGLALVALVGVRG